jgi:hypothetical protein
VPTSGTGLTPFSSGGSAEAVTVRLKPDAIGSWSG